MRATPLITDFSAGELGVRLAGRVDLPIYTKGCSQLENWIPFPEGGVITKPGSQYLGLTESGAQGVIISFTVNDGASYIVELTPLLLRFWHDDLLFGAPLELVTTYATLAQLRALKVAQDGNKLYFFHKTFPIRVLTWTGATFTWTLPTIVGNTDMVPFQSVGNYPGYGTFFGGRLWCASTTNQPETIWGSRSYVYTYGDPWQISTGYEIDMIVENDTGKLYKCVQKGVSAGAGGPTGTGAGIVDGGCKWDYWTAEDNLDFTYFDRMTYTVDQLKDPASWADPDVPELETITSYRDVISASNAIEITLASEKCDEITSLIPGDSLLVGTVSSEYLIDKMISAIELEDNIKRQTHYGVDSAIQGVLFHKSILFLQSYATRLREYRYTSEGDAWESPDLTFQAKHIMGTGGAIDMDIAFVPEPLIYLVRSDGEIALLVKEQTIGMSAWCRLTAEGGLFESVAVIQGSSEDAVYALVNRGANYVCLEKFDPIFDLSGIPLDSQIDIAVAGATQAGLDRFDGETVTIYNITDATIRTGTTAAGTLTFHADDVGDHVVVGICTKCSGRTMRVTTSAAYKEGDMQIKRIGSISVRLDQSYPFKLGYVDTASLLEEAPITGPFTGDVECPFRGNWDRDAWIMFIQDEPYRVTILSMIPEIEI